MLRDERASLASGSRTAPDLTALLVDTEPSLRRRSALAIGRVGIAEGVPPLIEALGDPEPEVRQMAAFSLEIGRAHV